MGYLYGAIHAAREEILQRFVRRRRVAQPFIEIIDKCWDSQLGKYIHAAGFWLNPSNQYDITEFSKHRKTISGMHDVIERFAHGNIELQTKLTNELRLFRNAEGDFGRPTAIRNRSMMSPAEWWITYGSSAPNLQKLAIRVLSQTCSSSGCERNWSVFEFIHSKKRNRMEHQRLNDLVYVRYNLKLHQRIKYRGQNYDPISFEDFADNGQWVLEDDPPFLTVEEIEEFRKQMAGLQIQANESDDELVNLDDLNSDHGIESQENEDIENTGAVEETTRQVDGNEDTGASVTVTEWNFAP